MTGAGADAGTVSLDGARAGFDERGATLIEIIVVMAVIVPVILAATLGLMTTVRLSANTHVSQELDAAATSFAESLKEVAYVDCATVAPDGTSSYDGATGLWTPPSHIEVGVERIEYWRQSSVSFEGSCAADEGAQLIEVRVTDGDASLELEVTKRDPAAAPELP